MRYIYGLLIGAAAGFLAGQMTKGSGFGLGGNILVGVSGAIVGSLLFGLLGFQASNMLGSLITATVGAVALLWLLGKTQRLR